MAGQMRDGDEDDDNNYYRQSWWCGFICWVLDGFVRADERRSRESTQAPIESVVTVLIYADNLS